MNVRRLLLGFIATLLFLGAPQFARAERINIAAVVNDDIITTTDVSARLELIMALGHIEPTAEAQQKLTPRILQSLIDEALEMQEAKRLSLTISDEDVAKAVGALETDRHQPPGSLRAFVEANHLSMTSLESQLRAQLAWTKVVQRKLRRSVSVSQDEVLRAQQAAAAAPGISELRLAALAVPIAGPGDEDKAKALADQLAAELKQNGNNLGALALAHEKDNVVATPSRWVSETTLPPPLAQVLDGLKPGEVTPPLHTANAYQIVQLSERRVSKPLPDNTEVVIKEIRIPTPATQSKDSMEALRQQTLALRAHPGSCTEESLGAPAAGVKVQFLRAKLGSMVDEVRAIVTHLNVGDISDPVITPQAVELVMLCERIEPAIGGLPDEGPIRQKLFEEKLELEAEKYLRDLRRDAYIDIKGGDAPHAAIP